MNLVSLFYGWQYSGRQWAVGCATRVGWWAHAEQVEGKIFSRMPWRRHGQRLSLGDRAEQAPLEPRRILLIIAGLIGDTVMSTPVIVEARRIWPESEIVLLGRRHNCELLSACPLLDACIEAPAMPFALTGHHAAARMKDWLREQRFDLALILLGDQFASVLAEARIPIRVGVRGHSLEPCLTHTYSIGSPRTWGPSERLNALRALGYEVQDVPPRLWVSNSSRDTARQRLGQLGLAEGVPYAALHPFGSTRRQWWTVERVEELAEELWYRHGLRTVLIGGPEARGRLPASAAGRVTDATGTLSIPELLAVLERASLVISTDSGPFHLAGALGRPTVGLFRARRPEHADRYPTARVVFGRDSTCMKRCRWDRCRSQLCLQLNALRVEEVEEAVRQLKVDPVSRVENIRTK
jgi:ADP-heptose:LPS heptosyltransferase